MSGDTLRTFSRKLKPGMNRIGWGMDRDGIDYPSWRDRRGDAGPRGGGPRVLPGTYKFVCIYGDFKDSTTTTVHLDPRLDITTEQMMQQEMQRFEDRLDQGMDPT